MRLPSPGSHWNHVLNDGMRASIHKERVRDVLAPLRIFKPGEGISLENEAAAGGSDRA